MASENDHAANPNPSPLVMRPDVDLARYLELARARVAVEEGLLGKPLANQRLMEVMSCCYLVWRGIMPEGELASRRIKLPPNGR